MIRFSFNERKSAQAAAHLIARKGGRINYMLLVKLLYLADRESLLERGRPITGDELYAMKHGPAVSRVLNLIRWGKDGSSLWFDYITEKEPDYTVALRSTGESELSMSDLRILDAVFAEYGHWDQFALRDHLHKILPEWSNPGETSMLIDPETILRIGNKTPDEIAVIAAKASEDRFFDQL